MMKPRLGERDQLAQSCVPAEDRAKTDTPPRFLSSSLPITTSQRVEMEPKYIKDNTELWFLNEDDLEPSQAS